MGKKVVVVGAGIGGLSAAIRLQHAGYSVEIYEKQSMPGGKMHQIHEQGFTFDVGPTIVMMPSIYQDIFRLCGRNPDDYIPMTRLDPMYEVFFEGSPMRHYAINNTLPDLMKMVESKGPENAKGFLDYLSVIHTRYQVAYQHFITRPFRHRRDMYNPYMLVQAMKLKTFDSADHMMAKFMSDKDLQRMLSFQTLYIGVSPANGPSLYNIIPMIELLYGIWFIKGGMHTMAEQMARLFEEIGGKIHYNADVQSIVTSSGSNQGKSPSTPDTTGKPEVKGIEIDGRLVKSPYVVCNADFPYAMKHLIDNPKVRGKYSPKKIDKMDYSCSCLVFYWGVKGTYDKLSTHNFVISSQYDENLRSIFDGTEIQQPSIYLHIPTQTDASMAPDGMSAFYALVPISELGTARYEWNEQTVELYRNKVMDALTQLLGLERLKEDIVFEKVFTPHDFAHEFNAYRGATFGLQPTLLQSNHWRPQAKAKHCKGLYFTGSSTHPGAGVPIVMQSGKICAEELRRDEKGDTFE
ncbi:MAG: phytoene desaturase family protein [Bifidobacterium aquikefiri]|uniref:Dehydrosqualene desaturase n=1 Tax=Bifidobacterium aquikefiri TaxID=1653207 RepID=A0A261G7Q2_9BIFI|nr:phytoene desaturase family protein [Bifidobacterium aquikefiri]OZG67205.1 dehydrosqualene desaturase [Bifidobacterium aquikefiri]